MSQVSVREIVNKAAECAKANKSWHFHILAPECSLNKSKEYVLMLEDSTDDESFIYYSKEPLMSVGEELVKLLHGDDIVGKPDQVKTKPSPDVAKMLERARELNEKGEFWHHHMLFPDCIFNQDKPKWVILFEDTDEEEIIKSVSDAEPKSDLNLLEVLFYKQLKP